MKHERETDSPTVDRVTINTATAEQWSALTVFEGHWVVSFSKEAATVAGKVFKTSIYLLNY